MKEREHHMRRRNVKEHRTEIVLLYVITKQDSATTNLCHVLSFLFNLVYYYFLLFSFLIFLCKISSYRFHTETKKNCKMKSTHSPLPDESKEPISPGSSHRKQNKEVTKTCFPESITSRRNIKVQPETTPVLSGRERLKRHREEVAGKVPIPESWDKEGLLVGWMDFSTFDASFTSSQIVSARAALMADAGDDPGARESRAQRLRVESSC